MRLEHSGAVVSCKKKHAERLFVAFGNVVNG